MLKLSITYVLTKVEKNEETLQVSIQTEESKKLFDLLTVLSLFSMLISVILVISITISIIASLRRRKIRRKNE